MFEELLGYQPDEGFLKAVGEYPLYSHQEQAIRESFKKQNNIVVATGTASGKTEAFLHPILLHLYQEFQAGQLGPGVRALILYPMNALANDQHDRLGKISKHLEEENTRFRFSFGQYIGGTPEDESDSKRNAHDWLARRWEGELVLRREMRQEPPHILLTNYSMLEYLLLRPYDSPLFNYAQWWRFLILDEAHQYRGSRGIEMAMLLRRLKQRLWEEGCPREKRFQCIATSATLGREKENKTAIAEFASNLFGEEFTGEAVILTETQSRSALASNSHQLKQEDHQCLWDILNGEEEELEEKLGQIANKLRIQKPIEGNISQKVGEILQRDMRVSLLQQHALIDNPKEVYELANSVFKDIAGKEQRVLALSQLIELLSKAEEPSSGSPLLSARYHFFLRSLEGAFISYWPRKGISLERKPQAKGGTFFEAALCRQCGQHYLVGAVQGGKLVEANRDPGHPHFGAQFFRAIEDLESIPRDNTGRQIFKLCTRCGQIGKGNILECGHNETITVEQQEQAKGKEDQISRCALCEYKAPDPVREVVYGAEEAQAAIAITLYQNLPQTKTKTLAFADGRQDAAFFSWHLANSYQEILQRNLLFKVLQEYPEASKKGLSFEAIVDRLENKWGKIYEGTSKGKNSRDGLWKFLYREFLAEGSKPSLESVGLARWTIKWPNWLEVPKVLLKPPWSLSEKEAREVVLFLLDTMRMDKAVEIHIDSSNSSTSIGWKQLGIQEKQMRIGLGKPKGRERSKDFRNWAGETGKRTQFLAKLRMRMNPGLDKQKALKEAKDALMSVWDTLEECDKEKAPSEEGVFLPIGGGRRLNPDWWRLYLLDKEAFLYRCDLCNWLQTSSIHNVCPRYHCSGTLKAIQRQNLEPNYYRFFYEQDLPSSFRVEEHTAQLAEEKAREYQTKFRNGHISMLSSSTTFELGVDLGDLDNIFLRNVPPETFNYAQRAGRAGRRREHPGFILTFCRRNPHDLYHFAEPKRMLAGQINPPVLNLSNERIILCHATAFALSHFFRYLWPHKSERLRNVQMLLGDFNDPYAVVDLKNFLQIHKSKLENSLCQIIPKDMLGKIGLIDDGWVEEIDGKDSNFALAESEVSNDFQAVGNLEAKASKNRDYKTADWAKDRAKTIADEDITSFLSRKAVIPKYGFPVDVVELDPQRTQQNRESREVLLQRDLSIAIAEFAPTSRLVVNKKEWVPYAVKKFPGREWERRYYKRCLWHSTFCEWKEGEFEPFLSCGCNSEKREYIVPKWGFQTKPERPKEPKSRPVRPFTTRPYFGGFFGPVPGLIHIPRSDNPSLSIVKACPGYMVSLCEGRRGEGFYICDRCGTGFRGSQKQIVSPHEDSRGQDCYGELNRVALGHHFITDIVRLHFQREPGNEMEPIWFAYSLAYALVEGVAKTLETPTTDLKATVEYRSEYPVLPIILYDNVPGGAALVAQLENKGTLRICLENALEKVSHNCCDENSSCYSCLRNYENQFAHQCLQRGPVKHYLEKILLE